MAASLILVTLLFHCLCLVQCLWISLVCRAQICLMKPECGLECGCGSHQVLDRTSWQCSGSHCCLFARSFWVWFHGLAATLLMQTLHVLCGLAPQSECSCVRLTAVIVSVNGCHALQAPVQSYCCLSYRWGLGLNVRLLLCSYRLIYILFHFISIQVCSPITLP